ncbi:MAG TPA: DUF2252 domain-containing protein [Bryobacteraceae bacterium]|nr:DUF2252 domain-containing protein [Bryobacteraceae bacterium]
MAASTGVAPIFVPPNQKRPSPRERLEHGRAQRKSLPRAKLSEVLAQPRGYDPIDLLRSAAEERVPKLLPEKYRRMACSPFAFFRGAVAIMAADLASCPNTGLQVQLCGDAHVQNMGSFEGPDGRIIFDVSDFDETIPGPWDWDVKRMAASIVLAGYEANHSRAGCIAAVDRFLSSYCTLMEELAEQPVLVAARHQIHESNRAQAVSAALKQAQRASPCDLLRKYTDTGARGQWRFKTIENTLWPVRSQTRQDVLESLLVYRESLAPDRLHLFSFFRPVDVAFKIVGTGSVGLRDYVVLLEGNGLQDPLFLQIKQETHSAYAAYLQNSTFAHQGRRVADGQRKMQPLSDLLLGWTRIGGHDYLVRQLNDHKGSIDIENLRANGLESLARVAGELLARGHARSGDALALKGYIGRPGRLVEAITKFGVDYATQTQHDFEQFQKAIQAGRIKVNGTPPSRVPRKSAAAAPAAAQKKRA